MICKKDIKILVRFCDGLDNFMAMKKVDFKTATEIKSILFGVLNTINYKDPGKILSVDEYRDKLERLMISRENQDEIDYSLREFIASFCDCLSRDVLKMNTYLNEGHKLKCNRIQSKYVSLVREKIDKYEFDLIEIIEMFNDFLNCQTDFEVETLVSNIEKEEHAA